MSGRVAHEPEDEGPDPRRNADVFLDLASVLEAVPPPPREGPLQFPVEVWR